MTDPVDLSNDDASDRWTITDDGAASWALRTIAAARTELARIQDRHQAETERIDEAARLASAIPQRTIDTLAGKLIDYRMRLEAADPNLPRSYRLLVGSIRRRRARAATVITDERALVDWCLGHAADAVRSRVLVSQLVATSSSTLGDDPGTGVLVSADGEIIPGIEHVRGDDVYDVEVES